MDDETAMDVLEAIAAQEYQTARALLAAHEGERVRGLQAYLEDAEAGRLEDLEFPELDEASVPAITFSCMVCSEPCGHPEEVLLNTRFGSFFRFDMAEASAATYTCTSCRHVHWFARGNPVAWQGLGRDSRGADGDGCAVCGYEEFTKIERQVNTRGLTLLNLDFLNKSLEGSSCVRCGYIHWFSGPNPWQGRRAPDTQTDHFRCLVCDNEDLHTRQGLLNHRVTSAFGLDWLDPGARVASCRCGATYWFGNDSPLF